MILIEQFDILRTFFNLLKENQKKCDFTKVDNINLSVKTMKYLFLLLFITGLFSKYNREKLILVILNSKVYFPDQKFLQKLIN